MELCCESATIAGALLLKCRMTVKFRVELDWMTGQANVYTCLGCQSSCTADYHRVAANASCRLLS